ncbi:hypothetical protein At15955_44730 [Agrobacterium tumefaciens]|nr:AsnC family transcriptional regulator [Agrobacterium tumefaciens]AYM19458.1 hypothetical protein At15955_44730 [Agrobacterium tumefaciens]
MHHGTCSSHPTYIMLQLSAAAHGGKTETGCNRPAHYRGSEAPRTPDQTDAGVTVGLSTTPAWARLKRIEAQGLVTGFHARLSRAEQLPVWVLMDVTLASHRRWISNASRALSAPKRKLCPASQWRWRLLFLTVETTDIDSYRRIVGRMLAMEIGIHRRFTHILNRAEKGGMD